MTRPHHQIIAYISIKCRFGQVSAKTQMNKVYTAKTISSKSISKSFVGANLVCLIPTQQRKKRECENGGLLFCSSGLFWLLSASYAMQLSKYILISNLLLVWISTVHMCAWCLFFCYARSFSLSFSLSRFLFFSLPSYTFGRTTNVNTWKILALHHWHEPIVSPVFGGARC